jgi:hypothetical protein
MNAGLHRRIGDSLPRPPHDRLQSTPDVEHGSEGGRMTAAQARRNARAVADNRAAAGDSRVAASASSASRARHSSAWS